jgi:hypothetical protein
MVFIYLFLFIYFNSKGFLPGGSGTTITHNTQITHIAKNNTPRSNRTTQTKKDTLHTMNFPYFPQSLPTNSENDVEGSSCRLTWAEIISLGYPGGTGGNHENIAVKRKFEPGTTESFRPLSHDTRLVPYYVTLNACHDAWTNASRARGSATDKNGFWIGWFYLLTLIIQLHLITITYNSSQLVTA